MECEPGVTGVLTSRRGVLPLYSVPFASTTRPGSKKALFTLTILPAPSKARLLGAVSTSPVTLQSEESSSATKPSLISATKNGYSSLANTRSKPRQSVRAGTSRSRAEHRDVEGAAKRRAVRTARPRRCRPAALQGSGQDSTVVARFSEGGAMGDRHRDGPGRRASLAVVRRVREGIGAAAVSWVHYLPDARAV